MMTVMTSAKAKQSSDPLQRRQTLGNPITWLGYARICLDPEELHIFASPEITRERRRTAFSHGVPNGRHLCPLMTCLDQRY